MFGSGGPPFFKKYSFAEAIGEWPSLSRRLSEMATPIAKRANFYWVFAIFEF